MSSDSEESEDSFSSFQEDFDRLTGMLRLFASDIESLGSNLEKMQKPIENLEFEQLADPSYLEKSPFRSKAFLLKREFSGIDINKRHPFRQICEVLRKYLFAQNLVQADGTVLVNETIRKLFDIEEQSTTYLDLIGKLKLVLL